MTSWPGQPSAPLSAPEDKRKTDSSIEDIIKKRNNDIHEGYLLKGIDISDLVKIYGLDERRIREIACEVHKKNTEAKGVDRLASVMAVVEVLKRLEKTYSDWDYRDLVSVLEAAGNIAGEQYISRIRVEIVN